MQLITVNPTQCTPWKLADRSGFEFGDIYALTQDIVKNGQIEPVLLRSHPTEVDQYEIIAGARRWKACMEKHIPLKGYLQDLTDQQAAIAQMKENQNLPLCDYSKGVSYAKMLESQTLTLTQLAEIAGYSRAKLQNFLAFERIAQPIIEAIDNLSRVSSRTAATIVALQNKGQQYIEALIELAEDIRKGVGSKTLEKQVMEIINGSSDAIDYKQAIKLPSGQVIATWEKQGLKFARDIPFNQDAIANLLVNHFQKENALM